MDNLLFFIIIIGIVIGIYYIHSNSPNNKLSQIKNEQVENFDIGSNKFENKNNKSDGYVSNLSINPYVRCELMSKKKFMVRDLRTKLWLISGQEEGFNKFLPGRFGNVFMMSSNPDEYLPLRTIMEPNDYLLATFNGDGIRTVSNPNNQYFIIQVFSYNGFNVLGYITESNSQKYLYIDDSGHIHSVKDPERSSQVEIFEV